MNRLANDTVWLEKFADDSLVIVTGSDSALATRDQIFYSEALGHFFSPNQPTVSQGNWFCLKINIYFESDLLREWS